MLPDEKIPYKLDDLGHLDLSEDATTLVITKIRRVADRESVGSLDGDLSRLAPIQLAHTLNLTERDEVTILETVTSLV